MLITFQAASSNNRQNLMASITILDLRPTGSDLFSDSESFFNDLSEEEAYQTHGGWVSTPYCVVGSVIAVTVVAGAVGAGVGYVIGKVTD